ncbi:androglobin isoform X2 [Scyliorhinus torazame]|uniref:androglobin isoform X2 n=1 Tax=Scyliorhinus torazame TaxID=75743 RepID=UPI003B590025
MSKSGKKRVDSTLKASPTPVQQVTVKDTASFVLSCGWTGGITESRKGRYPLWPEWNEADVNAEKWDLTKPIKEKEKSIKSPNLILFEDPEGKIELPPSLKIYTWRRPHEFITEKLPVVIERETSFDLIAANEHIMASELMRWIISEIIMLWATCQDTKLNDKSLLESVGPPWKPWEHVYALCKAMKGHVALYNSYGKYVVRLYWMGCWRKITVDDTMPFDRNDNLLLPTTTCYGELWPMLLSKALIKIASIDMNMAGKKELGEFTVLHALTGWHPEIIPLRYEQSERTWSFLKTMVPEFNFVNDEPVIAKVSPVESTDKTIKEHDETVESASVKPAEKVTKGIPTPVMPRMLMYATYFPLQLSDRKISLLGQMADSSEKLRHYGLSHAHSHPVLITRTRSCPLVNPPEIIPIPRWKLIRPRNRALPIADPKEPKVVKSDQFVEISSPLLNYKIDTTIIPPERTDQQLLFKKDVTTSLAAVNESEETLDQNDDVDLKTPETTFSVEETQIESPKSPKSDVHYSVDDNVSKQQYAENVEIKTERPAESIKSGGQHSSAQHSVGSHAAKSHYGSVASRHGSVIEHRKETHPESIKSGQFSSVSYGAKSLHGSATAEHKEEPLYVRPPLENLIEDNTPSHLISGQLFSQMSGAMLNIVNIAELTNQLQQKIYCTEKWIDYEDFFKCFQKLIIFHNPSQYTYSLQKSCLKPTDDRGPYYLHVDDTKPIEMLITFSALVRWGDISCEKNLNKGNNDKDTIKDFSSLPPGMLIAESYSWKSLATSPPILCSKTVATKSTILELPCGRHVIRFTAICPLGHNISISSTVPFTFGDEDTVLATLSKDSLRFSQHAARIMKSIENAIINFNDKQEILKATKELLHCHFPYEFQDRSLYVKQIKVFNSAVYATVAHALEACPSIQEYFALKTVLIDTSPKKLAIRGKPCQIAAHELPETWKDRNPTKDEHLAANKLQNWWRGVILRELRKARIVGLEQNDCVNEVLRDIWDVLEADVEQHGLFLLRYMFTVSPELAKLYPFYEDEWSKTVYADYATTYSDQPPNSWFVVFRETFHVPEDMLVVPKIYSVLPACVLHVVNNDTGEEVPRVFQKVVPFVYTKNLGGYTFTVEAQTGSLPVPPGKWKLRLIGSMFPLPSLASDTVNYGFSMKEIKSYYIPNDKNIIFRYQINAHATHLATLHIQTSKPDVYIKLQILDNDKEVAKATGKGHAVIPSFLFISSAGRLLVYTPSRKPSDAPIIAVGSKKLGSTSSSKTARSSAKASNEQKSPIYLDEGLSRLFEVAQSATKVVHKYMIQALVLRKSWPLTDSELTFAESQDVDNNELTGRTIDPVFPETEESKPSTATKHSRKGKAVDKDKGKEKNTPARIDIPVLQIDTTKPHFTLHYVTDYGESDCVEIKKDSERQDEIRAMKRAWEDAEPGRAFKALQLRLHIMNYKAIDNTFLSTSGKEGESVSEVVSEADFGETGTQEPPTDNSQDVDENQSTDVKMSQDHSAEEKWTRYVRTTRPMPVLLDESVFEEQGKSKTEEIRKFRQRREVVLQQQERERLARHQLKAQQLTMYENLQVALDDARDKIYQLREVYRNKLIEEELKQQEIAAMEAALRAEQERKALSSTTKASKGSGKRK